MSNLVEQTFEMDMSEINDNFRFYLEKDLTLSQIDAENNIASLEARIKAKKNYITKGNEIMNDMMISTGSIQPSVYDDWNEAIQELEVLEDQLKNTITYCDSLIEKRENGNQMIEDFSLSERSEGKEIVDFLHCFIGKLSTYDLLTIYQVAIDKFSNKEIGWYYYLVIGISTTRRLARQTKKAAGWWEECDRLKVLLNKYQPRREIPTAEDRFYASMSIDMEGAIDLMRYYRREAIKYNCKPEDIAMYRQA